MEAGMTLLRQSRWISTFLVAVVAFAWLVASNHCALAALEGARKVAHACCHETGQDSPRPQSTMLCCDTFHVTVPTHAVVPSAQLQALVPTWLETSVAIVPERLHVCRQFHATDPPRVLDFAEMVLSRSLFSHAPPRFVA